MFQCAAEVLKFTMAGFGVQEEPHFTEKLNDSVTSLFKALKDPSLPLMEMQVCVCVWEGGREGGGLWCVCGRGGRGGLWCVCGGGVGGYGVCGGRAMVCVCVWGEGYGVCVGGRGEVVRGSTSFLLISQEMMSAISSRIPTSVEEAIQSSLAHYANNLTSVLCQFPSQQVRGGEWGSV